MITEIFIFVYFFEPWGLGSSFPPAQQEVLKLIATLEKKLLIELKGPFSGLPDRTAMLLKPLFGKTHSAYPELPRLVAEILRPYLRQVQDGQIVVQSFHMPYLQELRSLVPDLQLMYLTLSSGSGWWQREDLQRVPLNFSGVSVRHAALTPNAVKVLREVQGRVFAWTVDSESRLGEVMDFPVDGIITNWPERALALAVNAHAPKRRRCCPTRAKLG